MVLWDGSIGNEENHIHGGAEENDFDNLMNSPYMFARKFDETNMKIVEKIFREINRRNNDEQ